MSVRAAGPRLLVWAGIIVFVTLCAFLTARNGQDGPITSPPDFRAFYCAGRAVLAHADPYRAEPARTCQAAALASQGLRWVDGLVVPSPQPPYTLAFLSLFGTMPFRLASALWFALLVVAWLRTVLLLRDLTGLRIVWPVLATLVLGLLASTTYGKMMPLTMWFFVETAAALRGGDDRRAAVFATLGTMEPHIGGPVWLALFALRPGARRALVAGALGLLVVSLVALRPDYCFEWLTRVLPAQSMSELRDPEQYSLTTFLVLAGMAPAVAHVLGELDYGLMLLLGIWAAARVASLWRDCAVIALIPPAFVVLGGMYMHENQLAAAIPIGLLAFARTRRKEFALAAVLLAVPWSACTQIVFPQVGQAFGSAHPPALPAIRPGDLAEVTWSKYVAAFAPQGQSAVVASLVKLPQWLGVALTVLTLLRLPYACVAGGGDRAPRRSRSSAANCSS